MSDDYPSAMRNLASGTPLSPLEYASAVLAAPSGSYLDNTTFELDNSNEVWETDGAHGNSLFVVQDPQNSVIYFGHANYIGSEIQGNLADLRLPAHVLARLGIAAGDDPSWEIYLAGAAIIAAAIALIVISGGADAPFVIIAAAAIMGVIGGAVIAAGAVAAVLTPQAQSKTCNQQQTSCCVDYTAPGTAYTTCADCTSGTCTSTTTYELSVGSLLTDIAIGLGVVLVVGVGGYATYKYVQNRGNRPRRQPPPQVPAGARGE
jgi:hypothetical protein